MRQLGTVGPHKIPGSTTRETWRACFPGRPAQGVSEARAAMRGRQETDRYRVFKRDDSIDVFARAVRSGTAHVDGAKELGRDYVVQVTQNQTWGGLDRRRCTT